MLQDDSDPDVDDDGNPLTVGAAQRIFHQGEGTKSLYCPKFQYENPADSLNQLNKNKAHIQDLIQKARLDQLERVGNTIGVAVKADIKVANMPVVRVLAKPLRHENK